MSLHTQSSLNWIRIKYDKIKTRENWVELKSSNSVVKIIFHVIERDCF